MAIASQQALSLKHSYNGHHPDAAIGFRMQ
jgi:hypothetical protein